MSAMTSARNGAATSANSTAVAPLLSRAKAAQRLRRLLVVAVSGSVIARSLLHEAGCAGRDLDEEVGQRIGNVLPVLDGIVETGRGACLEILRDLAGQGRGLVVLVDPV